MSYTFPTSTNETPQIEISVYPNPATSAITIDLNKPDIKILGIEIENIRGENLFRKTCNESLITLDVEKYPVGIYIVKLISGNSTYLARFCKI